GGLRHAAIDLLQESLDSYPSSPALLRTLGRAYLLSGQPDQAVIYLKRSLEASQANKKALQTSPEENSDDFTDDDLDFVDAQAEQQNELDYSPFDLEPSTPNDTGAIETPQPPPRPILHIAPGNRGSKVGKPEEGGIKIEYRNRRRIDPQDDPASPAHKIDKQPSKEALSPPAPTSPISDPDAQPVSIDQPIAKPAPSARRNPTPQQYPPVPNDQDATPFSSATSPLQSNEPPDHEPIAELGDQPPDDHLLEAPELDLDFDETESDEDESDYLIESLAPSLDDEETDELAWDDYDDLDEFDEQARRDSPVEPQGEGAISREIRARQAAAELLLTCDWHLSTIDLLQQIFVENGWGAARVAIEREIKKGLLPDELALARFIRGYWSENERFWTTYHRIRTNAPFMEAEAVYRHMSWAEALRIVRCFPALPASEEVMELIEDAYEWWYADRNLRRSFKTFLKFLKYRTGSMRGALPGHCVFSFFEWPENDSASESIGPPNPITRASQYLQDLGIQLSLAGEPPPRNIMSIPKEPEE
ncbi:MAG: tetratricopeptide repeat protein, partial [Pseudomonadota bacterium]|nr:tetratricopeptide repeat protein [Pseudomonadota bacterium]